MKTALVTGGNGAIGKSISRMMAEKNYRVILICRNPRKARAAVEEIIAKTGNRNVSFETADLSREKEIAELSKKIIIPVDVLINNAAFTPPSRMETNEGIEMQFASNVLNYFWMSLAFLPHLKESPPSRIVNVASHWAGNLDLNDLEFKKRRYDNGTAYRQSKQADRMLTVALSEKFFSHKISVNSCHPGVVSSSLSNSMGFGGSDTPDQGAATPVWLASSDEGQEKTGKWFSNFREERCSFSSDKKSIDKLWEICLEYTSIINKNI